MKGTYLLILQLDQSLDQLPVGRLGTFTFPPGYYLYVGSAFGAGGLTARLNHHQQLEKVRPHWHIDYLRPHTHLREIWSIVSRQRLEGFWCQSLVKHFDVPVRGFGASDSPCVAHLLYSSIFPAANQLSCTLFESITFADTNEQKLSITIHSYPSIS
jgi:Uri superfamily endonuclease